MAKDRDRQSEYEPHELERHDENEELDDVEADGGDEGESIEFEQPFCPRCGWHNTRPSHTSNVIDIVVRMFGFRPYRCRSCGNRFHSIRKIRKS
jgi:hypothetical protein